MTETLRLHQQLYNAALQQRREAWSRQRLSLATEAGETNPRHLKNALERAFVRASESWLASGGARATGPRPVSASLPCTRRKPIADSFLHERTAAPVSVLALIATEILVVKNAGGGARKKGLNREIFATSPARFLHVLRAKAKEAGLAWLKVPTRTVKPSQTCWACGRQQRKSLAQRVHRCACGTVLGRDVSAARLNWALSASGREPARCGGTAAAVPSKRETPPGTPARVE
ncbi:MAG TPA: zinc ribbon domain-containing protein [Anaeromyxobacteraceae bacterium]|nr:zinc ribbon domain-containing protein [Anaeromyxobacteraceae bacterium]